jgi:DNA-binding transcriptional regulator YiaG
MKYNYPEALVELRAKLNISQHELADILGVSYPSVSRWENGHFEPTKIVKVRVDRLLKENNIEVQDK